MIKDLKTKMYSQSWRINNLYKILDKDKKCVTFKMNKVQQYLYYIKSLDFKKRGCVRVIVLKARQHGVTTNECIDKLDIALFYENKSLKLSAHSEKKATEIFETVKFAYDNLPDSIETDDGKVLWEKPGTKYLTKSSIHFTETNSKIEVVLDTRSGTPSDVHITELAFVDQAEAMMTGTLPSVPKSGNITIESTANGAGGKFHEMWTKNFNNPKGTFTCVFFPWFLAPEYRVALDEGEEIILPEELKHLNNYPLDDEQKKFYIQQYFDLGEKVFQEYPSNADEAFLASGRLFFNMGIVKRLIPVKYTVDSKYSDMDFQLRWYNGYGPGTGKEIDSAMFGVDTSEGVHDGDLSSIKVRDRQFNLICSFKGREKPDKLVDIIDHIIENGVTGLIGIEKNNTGILTLHEAKQRRWYQMLYRTTVIDENTRKKTKKVGFATTGKTRPLILGELERLIRQGELKEIDEREKSEMGGFVYNVNGKPEASEGTHDDDILADAICCYMINEPQQITMSDSVESEVAFNTPFQ